MPCCSASVGVPPEWVWRAGTGDDDGAQVAIREAQVSSEERARDGTPSGLTAQPRLRHREETCGIGGSVQPW